MVVRAAPRAPFGSPANAPDSDHEHRRARPDAPPPEPGPRERRSIESLAIGAPLTAAFIGVLLVESGVALGGSASGKGDGDVAAAGGARAGSGADAAGRESGLAGWGQIAPADAARATDGDTGGAADLAAEPGVREFGEETAGGDGAGAGGLEPASEVSAGFSAKAAVIAGPEVNLTLLSADDALPGDGNGADNGGTGSSSGPIGKYIEGGPGGEVLHGTEFDDYIRGGAGDDVIYGYAGDDVLDGGPGNDRLFGGAGNDRLIGGEGHDHLHGGSGDDVLLGGPGNDFLFGGTGRDLLDGGAGNDFLDGGPGADRMIGGTGDDILLVRNIHDVALENARGFDGGGNDTLRVEQDYAQHLATEFGVDAATFVFSNNLGIALPEGTAAHRQQVGPEIENVTLNGSANHSVLGDANGNILIGNEGDNALYGRGGDDILIAGGGNNLLDGGMGNDRLYGGPGDDILRGGAGADELYGGAGDNILDGGSGPDLLYGGSGNDTFLLGLNDSAVDSIFDYEGLNQLVVKNGAGHLVETAVAGDELYVVVDKNPIAVVDAYRGNEEVWAGIDGGAGVVPIGELMAENAGNGPALASTTSAPSSAPQADLLAEYLSKPSLIGSERADVLHGTSGADWLVGNAGDDHLIGGAGHDILQGGPGNNLLEGGAGDDRYLFKSGDAGLSTIRDVQGTNVVQLEGFEGAKLQAVLIGRDLMVVADHALLFKIEDYVGNEAAFAGIERGDGFTPMQDLFA